MKKEERYQELVQDEDEEAAEPSDSEGGCHSGAEEGEERMTDHGRVQTNGLQSANCMPILGQPKDPGAFLHPACVH